MEQASAAREEYVALDRFLASLPVDAWERRTAFFDWSVADEVMHLHLIDLFGLESLTDAAGFARTVAAVRAKQSQGIELSAQMRERFGHLRPAALLDTWRSTYAALCERLSADDSKRRIPWFGPSMSVRSFATARQMEVWAHGQDIFDLFRVKRRNTDAIRNICDLGVRTFAWSFQNRGEAVPPDPPDVRLRAPSGVRWCWNERAGEAAQIEGNAEDFALVVTQRRHVADTALKVEGAVALRWMAIAQCFAGPPETGPAPGVRAVHYAGDG
jgi:uncharacterized protein (TIGR03084 family)